VTNFQGEITTFRLYYTIKDAEGSAYKGEWIQDVSKKEVMDVLVAWEPAVQQLLEVLYSGHL
jgi:hypothetical protein